MRYHVFTIGCQMNVADSQRMSTMLTSLGGRPTAQLQEADVVVLNTCSVRQAAEERAFGKLAALRTLKTRRPHVLIALAGCMVAEDSLPGLQQRLPYVDAFIRPSDVATLKEKVRAWWRFHAGDEEQEFAHRLGSGVLPANGGVESYSRTAAQPIRWVPVIAGCNRTCSYCIVPARRGKERSRPIGEIVAEVRDLVAGGPKEVRLLGQIIDRYGRDLPGNGDLADLFTTLGTIEGLRRIRFLTSHPRDLRANVIEAIARERKVCEEINLPFQSGDDAILKSMRRGYTVAYYRHLVEQLRDTIPGLALSTDVIVGYPGETEEQFAGTMAVLTELRFDVVHVAMYSPRPGTPAAALVDDVPAAVKKKRLERVETLQTEIAAEINAALVGKRLEVLVEGRRKDKWEGRTRTNKPVFFPSQEDWLAKLAIVEIERSGPWSLNGSVLAEAD